MPGLSDFLEGRLIDWWVKNTTFPAALTPSVWISLHDADPEGAGANELVNTAGVDRGALNYVRVAVGNDGNNSTNVNWSAKGAGTGTSQKVTNASTVTFAVAGGPWNHTAAAPTVARAIKYFGVWDQSSSGNFLGSGEIAPSGLGVTIQSGQQAVFGAGQLTIQVE